MTEKDKTLLLSVSGDGPESKNGYHFFLKAKHINIKTGSS
jgi:hypothetical protein